jgi:hypothetical protein
MAELLRHRLQQASYGASGSGPPVAVLLGEAPCCQPKPPDGHRQSTRELGAPGPLSVGGPAARTCPEVLVHWACHLTYT